MRRSSTWTYSMRVLRFIGTVGDTPLLFVETGPVECLVIQQRAVS
jgi:hypothetical protein